MKWKPPGRDQKKAESRADIERMRNVGVKWVEVTGMNYAPEECEAIRAIKGQPIEIEFAPELPLPGCDQEFCRCIIGAVEPPKKGAV